MGIASPRKKKQEPTNTNNNVKTILKDTCSHDVPFSFSKFRIFDFHSMFVNVEKERSELIHFYIKVYYSNIRLIFFV